MEIPGDTEIFESELATFWFNDAGMLCARAKHTARTLVRQKANYAFIRTITNNQRVCLLSDTSRANAQDRETREYTAVELENHFKAMAVTSDSAVGRMIANIFIAIKKSPIPIRLFENEKDAKEWLRQYL